MSSLCSYFVPTAKMPTASAIKSQATKGKGFAKTKGKQKIKPAVPDVITITISGQNLRSLLPTRGLLFPPGPAMIVDIKHDAYMVMAMRKATSRETTIYPYQVAELLVRLYNGGVQMMSPLKHHDWMFHWVMVINVVQWPKNVRVSDIIELVECLIRARIRYEAQPYNPSRLPDCEPRKDVALAIDKYLAAIEENGLKLPESVTMADDYDEDDEEMCYFVPNWDDHEHHTFEVEAMDDTTVTYDRYESRPQLDDSRDASSSKRKVDDGVNDDSEMDGMNLLVFAAKKMRLDEAGNTHATLVGMEDTIEDLDRKMRIVTM